MRPLLLTPRAQADLDEIWDYTAERWGERQAENYIRGVQRAAETLARDPRRARPCDDIRPGYRKHPVGMHVIFFRIADDQIEVVRILHQRMDFDQHL